MIKEFVEKFMQQKENLKAVFSEKHPENYKDIVTIVISALHDESYKSIDPERIEEINHGDYSGTLVYVIAESGYEPSAYWYVMVDYGSCSGCDTLESIKEYSRDKPNDQQVSDYMTLALHIVQGLKRMNDPTEDC